MGIGISGTVTGTMIVADPSALQPFQDIAIVGVSSFGIVPIIAAQSWW